MSLVKEREEQTPQTDTEKKIASFLESTFNGTNIDFAMCSYYQRNKDGTGTEEEQKSKKNYVGIVMYIGGSYCPQAVHECAQKHAQAIEECVQHSESHEKAESIVGRLMDEFFKHMEQKVKAADKEPATENVETPAAQTTEQNTPADIGVAAKNDDKDKPIIH